MPCGVGASWGRIDIGDNGYDVISVRGCGAMPVQGVVSIPAGRRLLRCAGAEAAVSCRVTVMASYRCSGCGSLQGGCCGAMLGRRLRCHAMPCRGGGAGGIVSSKEVRPE